MSYLRIAAAVAGVALLAFLWWRVSLSFAQADELEAKQQTIDALGAAAARDRRTADEIATFRGQQSDWMRAFHEELGKKPLMIEVAHVDPKTGATVTCRQRDPVRYRGLFNAAVAGTAAGVP